MENSEIVLECTASGRPPPQITWYHNGLKLIMTNRMLQYIDRKGTVRLSIMNAKPDDEGEFTCEAENSFGKDWTHCQVKVTKTGLSLQRSRSPSPTPSNRVPKPPMITRHLCDAKVHEGNRELLECEVDAFPEPTIEWLHDGNLVAESRTLRTYFDGRIAFLKLYEAHKDHQGIYECKIENKLGEATSKATITVETAMESKEEYVPNMPKFTQKLKNMQISREGESVELECKVEGNPEPVVKWLLNGKAIHAGSGAETVKNGNNHLLKIANFTRDLSGTYTVIATNIYGDTHSSADILLPVIGKLFILCYNY
uniref:Ig-like domain-containing protein n=1 Tax=Panagrolaimus sp. PS1159 TaxID=55785 RepID=A0AC35GU71_9BILA